MSEETFHLPTAGYERIARIIAGYFLAGAGDKPVSVSTVADTIAMKQPNISANNKFFLSTGILEKPGRRYQLTPEGVELARVLDHFREYTDEESTLVPEHVQSAWAMIVMKNDFLSGVTSAVRVRGTMETEAFARHIALTSGAPNKPHYLTGARTVISILKISGKLTEEDGILRATGAENETLTDKSALFASREQRKPHRTARKGGETVRDLAIPVTVMVQVTSATTDDELEGIAQKIKRLTELVNMFDVEHLEEDGDVKSTRTDS